MSNRISDAVPVGFTYTFELSKDDQVVDTWVEHNLIPTQGLVYLSNAAFGDTAAISTFNVGVFSNNYVPSASSVATDIPTNMGEFVGYSEATRPVWARVNTDGALSNSASRAVFTATASGTLYGGFLVSSATKGSGSGVLLSVARFSTPKPVEAGMVLRIRADISFIPTSVV